jgi:hypothetical protein
MSFPDSPLTVTTAWMPLERSPAVLTEIGAAAC